jgi:hypothetical protein
MFDHILNAAVGISAGVGALVSAFPRLQPHTLALLAPLHNQRAQMLKLLLLLRGNQRIIVINIPWYLA